MKKEIMYENNYTGVIFSQDEIIESDKKYLKEQFALRENGTLWCEIKGLTDGGMTLEEAEKETEEDYFNEDHLQDFTPVWVDENRNVIRKVEEDEMG